ncbi:MAG TPA: LapA family protein [Thermodesulfovibrionales bacterium]|nr:LapA family protein [Thermodesulfovibrionales bacterium]
MAIIILLLVIMLIVAVFSVQNAMPVAVTFFFWKLEASLAIVIFLSALCGALIGGIVATLLRMKAAVRKPPEDILSEPHKPVT